LSSAMDGFGEFTVNVSLAVLPVMVVPETVACTLPLVFGYVPAPTPVTLTVTVHDPPAETVPALRLMLPPFAAAVTVPPVQVVAPFGVAVFCKPTGYVSENATPPSASFKFGLLIVKVSVDVPPLRIGFGPNSFEMVGGFKTVSEALAIPAGPAFVPPSVDETNPLMLL
jgi:hypothetical protein